MSLADSTDSGERPALSVVLVGAGDARSIQKTFRHLAAQTIRDRVEVLVAVPSAAALDLEALPTEGFRAVRVIETGPIVSTAQSRVPAVHAAAAPVVAFAEDHSFPEPDWAERLVEAHEGPYAVVGPLIENANPGSVTARANTFIEYGAWMWADGPTEPDHLPGHNSAYKRDRLLAYGERLGEMLEAESLIHWDLRARGERLLLLSDIRTRHLNFSRVSSSLWLRLLAGRAFAGARSKEWGGAKRALYALASPAIPIVRLARTVRGAWRTPLQGPVLRVLPALGGLLALDGIGEFAGYAFGDGGAAARLGPIEVDRARFLRDADKPLAFDA